MRVLVVEDYEPLARSMTQGLRETGFTVDLCAEGQGGLLSAESSVYDVIVLDLMLPERASRSFDASVGARTPLPCRSFPAATASKIAR